MYREYFIKRHINIYLVNSQGHSSSYLQMDITDKLFSVKYISSTFSLKGKVY